jgi:hypothetical protein
LKNFSMQQEYSTESRVGDAGHRRKNPRRKERSRGPDKNPAHRMNAFCSEARAFSSWSRKIFP